MYIVDIDGTIANLEHRLHYIKGEKKDWDAFYAHCEGDSPIHEVIEVIETLYDSYDILFITGRSSACRDETLAWLDNNLFFSPYGDELLMRKEGDHRPDTVVKAELLEEYLKEYPLKNVLGIFEDRASVCKMWRKKGYRVFQVDEGDF